MHTVEILLIGLAMVAFFMDLIGKAGGRGIAAGLFLLSLWLLIINL